jgi:trigger factor
MFGWKKKTKDTQEEKTVQPPAEVQTATVPRDVSDFDVKITDRQSCLVTMQVQVPAEEVREANEESFRRIQQQAKLPGFRPGKAPLELVKKNYAEAAVEKTLDILLRQSVQKALEKEKLDPVASPSVGKIEYDPAQPLRFELKVECAPQVELKNYKGLALTKKVKPVADSEVDKRLEEIRESHAKLVASPDEVVADKHFVVVDYIGLLDGNPIEGGKAENQLIEMAASQTIAGFTEGLRGAKAGETREIPVKFPDDHPSKGLAGKSVIFKVTVSAVKEKQIPNLDDEFAKDLGSQSVVELKDLIRKNMEAERSRAARQDLENQATERLLELHDFPVPPSFVEERTRHLNERLKQYLLKQGASEQDWKNNEEKMADKNRAEAEKQVRLSYVLSAILEAEKIEVPDEELDRWKEKSLESLDASRRAEMQKWMQPRGEQLRAQLREEKLYTFLIDNAQVAEMTE